MLNLPLIVLTIRNVGFLESIKLQSTGFIFLDSSWPSSPIFLVGTRSCSFYNLMSTMKPYYLRSSRLKFRSNSPSILWPTQP